MWLPNPFHRRLFYRKKYQFRMLYLIGLGLGDAEDITCKGLKIVKSAKRVYLEEYTSIMSVGRDVLERFYGREVILADRELVEQQAEVILQDADIGDIAFLVIGDPLGATTHTDLILRAKELGIKHKVIHNASIINAIGCTGLQLYNFGEIVSIVTWTENWKPESFFDKIEGNLKNGLHTLCLLDLKLKEQSVENLMKGRKIYDPPSFLTASQAASQLVEIVTRRSAQGTVTVCQLDTMCMGVARVGSESQEIFAGTLQEMAFRDLGPPLHSLVVVGKTHPLEVEMINMFVGNKCK